VGLFFSKHATEAGRPAARNGERDGPDRPTLNGTAAGNDSRFCEARIGLFCSSQREEKRKMSP
jgi:hypothetical protein